MERAKGIEKKRDAFELTTRFSIYFARPRFGLVCAVAQQQRKFDKKIQRNQGTVHCNLSYLHGPKTDDL